MKKIISLVISSLLTLSLILTGCGQTSGGTAKSSDAAASAQNSEKSAQSQTDQKKVTIAFWYTANDADPADMYAKWQAENVKSYQEANPNVTIEPTVVSNGDQYLTKITTEMAADNVPDVFQTWLSGRLAPFVKANRIYPMNDEIEKDAEFKSVLNPNNLKTSTFDGKIYAIPLMLTGEVIFYNAEIFKNNGIQVPKTFDDMISIIKTLKSKGIVPMAMGNKDPWVGSLPYMLIFDRLSGPTKYEETVLNHTGKFTDSEYAAAAKKLLELRDAGAFPNNFNGLSYDEGKALFTSEKAAMYFMGTWELSALLKTMGNKLDFFNFPEISGGKGTYDDWILNQDAGFAVSNKSQNKKQAVDFIKFLFSKKRQAVYAETGALITTKNIPYDQNKIAPLTVKMNNSLANAKYGIIPWDNPLGQNIGKEFNNSTQAIMAGANIEETLAKLQKVAESEWNKK